MIVLFDPRRLIAPDRLLAWFREGFGRAPEKQIAPGQLGDDWHWHFIGYLYLQEFGMFPPRPPASTWPYSDPPYDETTSIFQDILEHEAMPPDPRIAYARFMVLVHPNEFQRQEKFEIVGKWNHTATTSLDDAFAGHSLPTLLRRVLVTSRVSWPFDVQAWADEHYPGAEIQFLEDSTAYWLDAIFKVNLPGQWPLRIPGESPPPVEPFKLTSPVPSIPLVITSRFNVPRDYDGDGVFDDKHEGVDLRAVDAAGKPVDIVACADGVVWSDRDVDQGGYGIRIVLEHRWPDGHTYRTWYAHMARNYVSLGQQIEKGQPVGLAGSTGNSTGIHLHLSLQHIGHGLPGYVLADIVDPTPYLPLADSPPPEPTPTKYTGLFGLHGNADGGPVLDVELELTRRMGIWGNPRGCWLWSPSPQQEWSYEVMNDNGAGIAYARQLVRLGIHKDAPKPAHFYVNGRAQPTGIWDAPLEEAGGFRLLGVVLGNEPNTEHEGLGRAWQNADDYCLNHLSPCIDLIRQHYLPIYPNMKLITPAIAPRENKVTWWEAFKRHNIFARCHDMGGHTYWDAEFGTYPMESENGGRDYRQMFPYLPLLNGGAGGKLYLTEVSCNRDTNTDTQKGDAYARWLSKVESDKIAWVTFFVARATDPEFNARRETWARYPGDVISDIPRSFAARWSAIP